MNKRMLITDFAEVTCKLKEAMVACADSIRLAEGHELDSFLDNLANIRAMLDEAQSVVERHMEATK